MCMHDTIRIIKAVPAGSRPQYLDKLQVWCDLQSVVAFCVVECMCVHDTMQMTGAVPAGSRPQHLDKLQVWHSSEQSHGAYAWLQLQDLVQCCAATASLF